MFEKCNNPVISWVLNDLRFLKKGIKHNGKYYPCYYWGSMKQDGTKIIRICFNSRRANGVYHFPFVMKKYFSIENKTDAMIDYFENDSIDIPENTIEFDLLSHFTNGKF